VFFFVPLTHDRTVHGAPWLTIGIIALCTLVAAATFTFEAKVETRLELAEAELLNVVRRHPAARVGWDVQGLPQAIHAAYFAPLIDLDANRTPEAGDAELDGALRSFVAELNQLPTLRLGYRPAAPSLGTLLSSAWMHADFMHLFGNMLFLFVAGTVIESRFSKLGFVLFYVLGGIVATATHHFVEYRSMTPLVGASGAIAALLGAAFVLHPRTKITFGYLFLLKRGTFRIPAWVCIPIWAAMQVLDAVSANGEPVAYFAHVGGFAFGIGAALVLARLDWLESDYDRLGPTEFVGLS
jgi:membrane associated rhomboid family serine protease